MSKFEAQQAESEELIEKLRSELGNPRLSKEGSPRQLDS